MNSKTYLYPNDKTTISGDWMEPRPPGWPSEGGWIVFGEVGDANGGLTLYLDRTQLLRLEQVVKGLVSKMPPSVIVSDRDVLPLEVLDTTWVIPDRPVQ